MSQPLEISKTEIQSVSIAPFFFNFLQLGGYFGLDCVEKNLPAKTDCNGFTPLPTSCSFTETRGYSPPQQICGCAELSSLRNSVILRISN